MRVEVTIGDDEPVVYQLQGQKILVGSAENAGIVIPSSAGISRKHVEITIDGENVFVSDLGSTNGTFINEERLVPGSKKPFTSFFPVRLSDGVFLTLLGDDDEAPASPINIPVPKKEASSPSITLNPPKRQASNTSTAIKARIQQREQSKGKSAPAKKTTSTKAKDSSRMKGTTAFVVLLIAAAGAYKFYFSPDESPAPEVEVPQQTAQTPQQNAPANEGPKEPVLIAESEYPSLDEFQAALGEMKCATALEKKLCELIPESDRSYSGVVESIGRVMILQPEKKWYKAMLETLPSVEQDFTSRTQIIYTFYQTAVPQFDWKEIDKNVYVVFYRIIDSRPVVSSVVGIKSSEITPFTTSLPKTPWIRGTKDLPNYAKFFSVIKPTTEPEPEPKEPAPAPPTVPVAQSDQEGQTQANANPPSLQRPPAAMLQGRDLPPPPDRGQAESAATRLRHIPPPPPGGEKGPPAPPPRDVSNPTPSPAAQDPKSGGNSKFGLSL